MEKKIINLTKEYNNIIIEKDTEIFALFIGKDSDKIETTLNIIHNKPGLKSNTHIKAVLYDESQFNMLGNVIINTGAKLTDAYLKIDVLLLSEGSKAKVIPSLEITENDVKGGHGATVGKISETQLFYMQSRGLTKSEAETLIVDGFISEIQDKMNVISTD